MINKFFKLQDQKPRRIKLQRIVMLAGLVMHLACGEATAKGGVFSSPHNLSASGGSGQHNVAFSDESRVCVFCHVPHNASQPSLLWSRNLTLDTNYLTYTSSTLKSLPADRPTGASRLCLSCHDGTIALGQFTGSRVTGSTYMPLDQIPTRNANLTTDLSDDHPISIAYTEALAAQAQLISPTSLPPKVRLDRSGNMQCTACHDPHDNALGNFLVIDNRLSGSPLCTACHEKSNWETSSHNPLLTPTLTSGCMGCHYAHSAPGPERLLHSPIEEDNCLLSCHDGSDTRLLNIRTVIESTLYRHPVDLTTGIHDPDEELPSTTAHVECVDCHNPHQANAEQVPLSSPPFVNGPLQGVIMDNSGTLALAEFEICFKCHAGPYAERFQSTFISTPQRTITEPDLQFRFDRINPSFHPVTTQRMNNGASLKIELQAGMLRIYCSDCHNSDQSSVAGGSDANGPHGSNYPHILIAQYEMPTPSDPTLGYSAGIYGLCFRCHEENFIMNNGSAFVNGIRNQHDFHVRERNIPCFVCHDPHGVPLTGGATVTNNAHLINFDVDYTASTAVPFPQYVSLASGSGSCTVSCHSNSTNSRSYAP